MKELQPKQTAFDLRFRLGGVPIRIHPLFWVASALLGIRDYADPEVGGLGCFAFWMAAVLVSVLLHELGHVCVGRLLGMRGEVVLYSLGSLTLGLDTLPRRRQRLAVLLAGPLVGLLIVAGVWGITWLPFPAALREPRWQTPIATGLAIVVWINLYWALLNLLPLWPLDGGRMACEIGEGLFGRRGVTAALVLSLVVAGLLAVWVMVQMSWLLNFRYDPRYTLLMEHWAVVLLFCFLFWVRGFGALWPAELPGAQPQERNP
jgi:Zn-dependent protease